MDQAELNAKQTCERYARELERDPLVIRYRKRSDQDLRQRGDYKPWHAQARKKVDALILCRWPEAGLDMNFGAEHRTVTGLRPWYRAGTAAHSLNRSMPFLWRVPVLDMVSDSPPPPPMVIDKHLFPFRFCYWLCAGSWSMVTAEDVASPSATDAILISNDVISIEDGRVGMGIQHRIEPDPCGPAKFFGYHVGYGRTWPDDYSARLAAHIEPILKMAAFLNSKYISLKHHRDTTGPGVERTIDEIAADAQGVAVVRLRELEVEPTEETNNGRPVDWSHRWWVRSHIRNQYCPSTKSHKPVWIAPHLKGPEDKPIGTRVYDVAR